MSRQPSMSSVLSWTHWARRMAVEQRLKPAEAHLLLLLAALGESTGHGKASTKVLGEGLCCHPKTAAKRFGGLVARGLVVRKTEAGGALQWRLNAQLQPVEQLGIDFDAAATRPVDPEPLEAPGGTPDPEPLEAPGGAGTRSAQGLRVDDGTRSPWRLRGSESLGAPHSDLLPTKEEEEGECAPERDRDERPLAALQPRLPDVLAALRRAPDLVVEDLAVDAALAAFPESAGYDHLQAAHAVASHALGERLNFPVANRLLMTELRKQGLAAAAGAQTPSRRPPRAHHRPGGQTDEISPALQRLAARMGIGDANRRPA